MKTVFKLMLTLGFLILTQGASAASYTVKKGDTLASVARTYYGEPVFGPKGSINKIYKLNPWAKANASLDPGQTITLEEKSATKSEARATAKATTRAPLPAPVPAPMAEPVVAGPPDEAVHTEAAPSASEAPSAPPTDLPAKTLPTITAQNPMPPLEETTAPVACPVCPETHEPPVVHEGHHEEIETPQSYFSVIANYSFIQKSATEVATGTSYTLNSSPAFGAELGWDHWWNHSLSTVLTYSYQLLSSKETGDATGAKVIDNLSLSNAEFSVLNRFTDRLRGGLGVAYGDHIFLENFTSFPVDPRIYKFAFFNPFALLEWTAFEGRSFDGVITAKAAMLPAQVGQGHDLTSGYEFMGQASLIEKFEKWSLIYAANYATENQTRTDANETSTRIDLRIGALF